VQDEKLVQNRLVSAPLVTVYTTRTSLLGGAEMLIGTSPRLFATSLTKCVGLITVTLVAPPVGAVLFEYFATVDLLTSHSGPCGARNAPLVLSYDTSSCALIIAGSVPLPFVTPASLATKTALALEARVSLSMITSFLPMIGMSAALAAPAPMTTASPTANAIGLLTGFPPLVRAVTQEVSFQGLTLLHLYEYRTQVVDVKGNFRVLAGLCLECPPPWTTTHPDRRRQDRPHSRAPQSMAMPPGHACQM
jgi:hypothetical protein